MMISWIEASRAIWETAFASFIMFLISSNDKKGIILIVLLWYRSLSNQTFDVIELLGTIRVVSLPRRSVSTVDLGGVRMMSKY